LEEGFEEGGIFGRQKRQSVAVIQRQSAGGAGGCGGCGRRGKELVGGGDHGRSLGHVWVCVKGV
jgi:hypothetical protein